MKKVVLITGGCQGLGKSIASRFNADCEVVILSNNQESLSCATDELKCLSYVCDITDSKKVIEVINDIKSKLGRIDVLINNAGVWVAGELDQNSYDDIARVILVNVVGTINITKSVLPFMKEQKSGKIINICSVDGLEPKAERSVYVASKHAITGFTDSLRKDVQKYGISVQGIYPGLINTSLFKNAGVDRDLELNNSMSVEDVAKVVEMSVFFEDIVFEKIVFRSVKEKRNG